MVPSFHEMKCISRPRKLVKKRLGPDSRICPRWSFTRGQKASKKIKMPSSKVYATGWSAVPPRVHLAPFEMFG